MKAIVKVLVPVFMIMSVCAAAPAQPEYVVGVEDVLDIHILQPEMLMTTVTVAPDGAVAVPYIGRVQVKGLTLSEIKDEIVQRLTDGYMKYPVVYITLKASRSRKFFVYGEVVRPGAYLIEENMTVLKAISLAGGFSKFGSSSRVKVLRLKEGGGYNTIRVNIQKVMDGSGDADIPLDSGDVVVVSEGMF